VGTEDMIITVPKAVARQIDATAEFLKIERSACIKLAFTDPVRTALALSFGANITITGDYIELRRLHGLALRLKEKGYMTAPSLLSTIAHEGSDRKSFEHSGKVANLDAVAAILRLYAKEIRNHGLYVSNVLMAS